MNNSTNADYNGNELPDNSNAPKPLISIFPTDENGNILSTGPIISVPDYSWIPLIDEWNPTPDQLLFKEVNKAMVVPVSKFYEIYDNPSLDLFMLSNKRCYNRTEVRLHIVRYLNYFENYFDTELELYAVYCKMKYMIDYVQEYSLDNFILDLNRYIIKNPSILTKILRMNEHNYYVQLNPKPGRTLPSQQYTTRHGQIMMMMSMLMDICIPVTTHFIYAKKISKPDAILLKIYDDILYMSDVDIYSKLWETTSSVVKNNEKSNKALWAVQSIRGNNTTTHIADSINNIILNIMPKYTYNKNIISFNFTSIRKANGYKITDSKYEFDYVNLSSSNRDDDFNSDFDKFESFLVKQDEGTYMINKIACQQTMLDLEIQYGSFDPNEINYFIDRLGEKGSPIIHPIQRDLIFNLFYKYFGDTNTIRAINYVDYIKLMIISRRMLKSHNLVILPYIFSSKITHTPNKKAHNRKTISYFENSSWWPLLWDKYRDTKIMDDIKDKGAVLLETEFKIIDFEDDSIDGELIENIPELVAEEFLEYCYTMI